MQGEWRKLQTTPAVEAAAAAVAVMAKWLGESGMELDLAHLTMDLLYDARPEA